MRRTSLTVAAVLALVLAACGGGTTGDTTTTVAPTPTTQADTPTTTAAPDDTTTTTEAMTMPEGTVTLAVMGPFTGGAASIGQEQLNFAKLAVEHFNARTGWNVQVFEGDTELDASRAVTVAEGIIADGSVYGVVGPAGSQSVSAVGEMFTSASLAFVSPSATNPDLTQSGFDTFYRVVPTDADQGPTIGNYIIDVIGASSVYIIDDQTSYSVGLADQIAAAVEAGGGEVAGRDSITQDLSDFSSLATVIGGSGAEVVAFPGQLASQGALLARSMQDQGVDAILFGGDGFFSPADFIEAAGGATEGAYVSSFAPDITGIPEAADIAAEFQERHGEFGTFGPPTYVAAQVIVEAMLRAFEANGELTREGVAAEVAATNLESTILGMPIAFDENGNVEGARFFIFWVQDGAFVLADS